MKFIRPFSTKQIYSLFLIAGAFIIFLVKPNEAYVTLRIIATIMIISSTIRFWDESIKRYKIIFPYKKNYYDSKAERKIASYFKRKNIIYHHHPTIKVPKCVWLFCVPFKDIKLEPDFFLPEFDIFVEYWGRIEDPEYKKNNYKKKMKLYKENSIDVLSLYPQNLSKNLDFVFTSKLLDIIKEKEGNLRKRR